MYEAIYTNWIQVSELLFCFYLFDSPVHYNDEKQMAWPAPLLYSLIQFKFIGSLYYLHFYLLHQFEYFNNFNSNFVFKIPEDTLFG